MTTSELIETAQRFGPHAKVILCNGDTDNDDFDISYLAMDSEMRLTVDLGNLDLQKQIKDLEGENDRLRDELSSLKSKIKELL